MNGQEKWDAAISIMLELERHGYEAVIVGGAVRDRLLGKEPGDVDVATEAEPTIVKEIFKKTADIGIQHGTIMVLHPHHPVEVTTYRTESSYSDHRRPDEVHFVKSLEEDLKRRDFTMNALAINSSGDIIDYFSGRSDINNKIIRSVGDPAERFTEDALRMMRAIRFAAQLNFEIEYATFHAIDALAPSITRIAIERIKAEMDKIFLSPYPAIGMRLLRESKLAAYLPIVNRTDYQQRESLWEQFDSFGQAVNGWVFIDLLTGSAVTEELVKLFKLSNAEKKRIKTVAKAVQRRKKRKWTDMDYYLYPLDLLKAAERYVAVLNSDIRQISTDEMERRAADLPIRDRSEILVNGHDLIQWSNEKGGPWVKQWLNRLEEVIVSGIVKNERHEIKEWFNHEFNHNK